jgi:hypothetical protein
MAKAVNILLIEDSPQDAHIVQRALAHPEGGPVDLAWSDSLADGLSRLTR